MLTQKLSITVTTVLLLCTLACNKNNINNTTSVIDTSIAKQLEGDYTESIRKTKTHQYPYQADDSLFTRQITLKKHTDTSLYMYGSYIADSMLIVIPNKDSTSFVADSNNSVVFVYTSITKGSGESCDDTNVSFVSWNRK